jgi:hypothetical protein
LSSVAGTCSAWAHSGLVATAAGELIGFHAGQLVTLDGDGQVQCIVRSELTEGHGITLVREGDQEFLWICDPGFVFVCGAGEGEAWLAPMHGKGLRHVRGRPRVVKTTLDGDVVAELPSPSADPRAQVGPMGEFAPCGCAVDEARLGGSGDVWVADGYGSSLVHRYDTGGVIVSTLSGEEGAGRFSCPHAVYINRRPDRVPELYVADRGNRRVHVYDLDGQFLRSFGEDFLNSPSGFARWGDFLVVAELFGRLAVLDDTDDLVGYIGAETDCRVEDGRPSRPGWPNALSVDGRAVAPALTLPDRFNSPHAVAVDPSGNLYVSEYLIGGRYAKVSRVLQHQPRSRAAPRSRRSVEGA